MKENRGITLIALVITIIVLIILAGVTLQVVLSDNGIINKVIQAKNKTEYASALEIIQLKIEDANIDKIAESQRVCTIEELAEYIGKEENVNVLIIKYYETASVSGSIIKPENISGFLVKASNYPKYAFLIGESCTIESVSTDDGITLIPIDEFEIGSDVPQENPKINSFEELLSKNGIPGTYTEEDVASNKDGTLEKILSNPNSIEYILNNFDKYMEIFISHKEAMTLLGEVPSIREYVINSNRWCEEIANSEYKNDFSEYIVYNKDTVIGTAINRTYYKRNDGNALAASFFYNGANFMIVSKDINSVLGWCTYNSAYDQIANNLVNNFEVNGEIWYYALIPFGGTHNEPITSTQNGKPLGTFSNTDKYEAWKDAVKYMVNDYLGINE